MFPILWAIAYKIKMRLVRYHVDAEGECVETVVMEPVLLDMNKFRASCSIAEAGTACTLSVTPRQTDSRTVLLTMALQELKGQGEVVLSGKNARRVKLGATVRILGMTNAADEFVHRAAQRGEIVTDHGEYTGYYVEVKPTLE